MLTRQFISRSLRHYRASYLGVLLGSALGTMVLLGALFSGDSVKATLRHIAEQRSGRCTVVLAGGEGFFRASLSDALPNTAPILQLHGQADISDGRSSGQVELIGVTPAFWSFALDHSPPPSLAIKGFGINRELAQRLDLSVGESLVLRLPKPSLATAEAPLSGESDETISLRGTVSHIIGDSQMGRFSLAASQITTPKVFLPLARLSEAIGQPNRANLLLFSDPINPAEATARVRSVATLADYGLSLQPIPLSGSTDLRSERIFLPPPIEEKARQLFPGAQPITTYLANTIAANGHKTPYSMVTGINPSAANGDPRSNIASFLPKDLSDDEIVLNHWEAEDLAAAPGDTVSLSYYVLDEQSRLTEQAAQFTLRSVIPMAGSAADPLWMPDFPGIAEADTSSDWSPGLPLDLTRIRDKDELYWDQHRGTPKAFITHRRAKQLWHNRWGASTSLRIPHPLGQSMASAEIAPLLLRSLTPSDAGLLIRDLQSESQTAALSSVDIASLFLSMSFFLILSAVALTAMLFRFNIEQRNVESGLLSALGIPAKRILRWHLIEGLIVVSLGAFIGILLAFAYTRSLLHLLGKIWPSSGDPLFQFYAATPSLIGGTLGFISLVMATIFFVSRKQAKQSPGLRLEAGIEEIKHQPSGRFRWIAIASVIVGASAVAAARFIGPQGAFFLAGICFLTAGLAAYRASLSGISSDGDMTPSHLARLNSARRPSRSLVVVGTLAAGLFLVVSVTAFQKHDPAWKEVSSAAGGYALWIETTNPLPPNFQHPDDILQLGEDRTLLGELLAVRVGTGDDASCFNLNAVTRPRLLAIDTAILEQRNAFTIKTTVPGIEPSWSALRHGDTLRAFIDETTLLWVLKKKVGDLIDYTDEQGNHFDVEIAGTLAASVFQGSFIVDEHAFLARYPSTPGPRIFLADSPNNPTRTSKQLQKSLADLGAIVMPTADRLAAFHRVENTYITIFNLLGGLGVILGSAGLGIVTARNLAERRSEFTLLHTLGIPHQQIRAIIIDETRQFIIRAISIGLIAALLSIIPSFSSIATPITTIAWILLFTLLICLSATFFAWLAYRTKFLPPTFQALSAKGQQHEL